MAETPTLFVYAGLLEHIFNLPARPWEVGGWLLGYWTGDESTVVVTHATPPRRGTPLWVHISGRGHRHYFDEAWEAAGGEVTFLGDWHTHPGGPPTPSDRDQKAIKQLTSDDSYGTTAPVIAVASLARWPWSQFQPCACFYTVVREKPQPLEATVIDELPPPADQVPDWTWPVART